jgi:large subunit ribosomal protein L15
MQIHTLQPLHRRKHPKTRVGRGGKRGTTSGRGTKGQRSRSGHRIRPAERDFIQRLPKLRGFGNPTSKMNQVVHLSDLASLKSSGEITIETLRSAGLISKSKGDSVKVLGGEPIKVSLKLRGLKVSASARKAIEEAKGSIR